MSKIPRNIPEVYTVHAALWEDYIFQPLHISVLKNSKCIDQYASQLPNSIFCNFQVWNRKLPVMGMWKCLFYLKRKNNVCLYDNFNLLYLNHIIIIEKKASREWHTQIIAISFLKLHSLFFYTETLLRLPLTLTTNK